MLLNRKFTRIRRGNIIQENFPTTSLIPMIEKGELNGEEEISADGAHWIKLNLHNQLSKYFTNPPLEFLKKSKKKGRKKSRKRQLSSQVSRKIQGDSEVIKIELTGPETAKGESQFGVEEVLSVDEIELIDEDVISEPESEGGITDPVEESVIQDEGLEQSLVLSVQEDIEGLSFDASLDENSLTMEKGLPKETVAAGLSHAQSTSLEENDKPWDPPDLDERVEWRFRKMSDGEMNVDPIEGEFFSTEHLDSLADALVRETIQNSLDAGLPGQQVRVRFRITQPVARNRHWSEFYLSGLIPHLEVDKSGLPDTPGPEEPLNFLLVEDYGTSGLEGDPRQNNDLDEAHDENKNDYFYFWRNVGRSKKGKDDRGRWGLGKTVYQATSRINTFFGVTVRASDGHSFLMGQSVLKTHLIDGTKHYPYGWYGVFNDDFAFPVDNLDHLIRFCEDLNLDRFGKSGLSMVIPFPDPTVEARGIVSSTLIHYIAPILSGDLVVDVVDKDTRVTIDKARIEKHISLMDFSAKKFTQESFGALIKFMRWAIDLPEKKYVQLKEGESGKAAKWSEDLFEPHILKTLRRQLEERRPIALRVPMEVQKKNGPVQQTYFEVFIQRDDDLDRAEDHFIREGITLAGVKSLRQKGIRAIVWVKDKALSSMLGDSENPAHTEWQERSPKFAGRYVRGTSALRFVKNSPKELINILYRPEQVQEEDPLLKFDAGYSSSGITMKPFRDNFLSPLKDSKKSSLQLLQEDKDFHLLRIERGFKVTLHPECSIPPSGILVSTAYEVRRGNPFSKYSIFDFDMGKSPIKIKTGGGRIVAKKLNRLFIEIRRSNFFLEVTGFDVNRDLRIKINPVR